MLLEKAQAIAQKYLAEIKPFCIRAEIAGSIRREKLEVKDIEIVAIRDPKKISAFKDWLDKLYKVRGDILGKYTQRQLPEGIKLDLFLADESNWGCIFLIRTGPWKFSQRMMGTVTRQKGFVQEGGYLWKNGKKCFVPTEASWFDMMGMEWVHPSKRF